MIMAYSIFCYRFAKRLSHFNLVNDQACHQSPLDLSGQGIPAPMCGRSDVRLSSGTRSLRKCVHYTFGTFLPSSGILQSEMTKFWVL